MISHGFFMETTSQARRQILNQHAVLCTGTSIKRLYEAVKNNENHLRPIQDYFNLDGSAILGAEIAAFSAMSIEQRMMAVFFEHFLPFIKRNNDAKQHIHLHCSQSGHPALSAEFIKALLRKYLPETSFYISSNSYLSALFEIENQLPEDCQSWLSITVDCLIDDKNLTRLSKKNKKGIALGEAYIIFQYTRENTANMNLNITPLSKAKLIKPVSLIFNHHLDIQNIDYLLKIQRMIEAEADIQKDSLSWLNPYKICGDTGVAAEALCLLLAKQKSSLILSETKQLYYCSQGKSDV
jgi:hypothetical protein